jgi:peptidoglycan hydrolase-like protein with peptidoglycan-binding domain
VAASGESLLFGDDEFAWQDVPVLQEQVVAPTAQPLPRPRVRPQTRTLAGDIARLRQALGGTGSWWLAALMFAAAGILGALLLVSGAAPVKPMRQPRATVTAPSASNAASSLAEVEVLRSGDEGESVRGLQTALALLGFDPRANDGFFGGGTSAAVVSFQSDQGLTADGTVGAETTQALAEALRSYGDTQATVMKQGLADAVAAGRLTADSGAKHEALVEDAVDALGRGPLVRRAYLALVVHAVAEHASVYDEPRALALFSMLEANRSYLVRRSPPTTSADVEGEDGIVYRFFPAHGFQFHPLANFARLNVLAKKQSTEGVRRLANALAARAVPAGKGLTWEYYFPFGGPSRWTSALAQAAGAQALARSGAMLEDATLLENAEGAFTAIPERLSIKMGGGLWVREYGFSDMAILNAQLQTVVSLSEYVETTDDDAGREVVRELEHATRALFYRFDTGCWSLYSLGGSSASASYHAYHVNLLKRLARLTGDPYWNGAATRWDGYQRAGSLRSSCT